MSKLYKDVDNERKIAASNAHNTPDTDYKSATILARAHPPHADGKSITNTDIESNDSINTSRTVPTDDETRTESDTVHGTSPTKAHFKPLDGGYCWVIVISSSVTIFLTDGILFSFGVLLVALIEDLDESTASVAALGRIFMGFNGISGIGYGFMFTPPLASVMEHFTTKRHLASGIALCGSGAGIFVMNMASSSMIEMYGWQGSLLILSAVMLNGIPCGLLIPREKRNIKRERSQRIDHVDSTHSSVMISVMERVKRTVHMLVWKNNISVVRNFKCLFILLSAFFFGLGFAVPFSYLPKQATTLGMVKQQAAWLAASSGLSNTMMRLGVGWIGTRVFANHKAQLSAVILLVDAACFPISLLLTSFGSKLAYAIAYGALYGANIVLYPVMLAESVPHEKADKAIGLFLAMLCTGAVCGVLIAGWTVDATGDLVVCYILAGVQTLVAAILMIIPILRDCVSKTGM